MGKKKNSKSNLPYYTFAGVWLILTQVTNLTGIGGLVVCLAISAAAAAGVKYFIDEKNRKAADKEAAERAVAEKAAREAEEARKAAESPYPPEVMAIIEEGRTAMKELGRLYKSIENPEIRSRINELMSVSDKIVRDAIDDPSDVPQIRKFLDYYLPTTIKLLNTYDRMNMQGVSGENITGSMQRIEEMLDTSIEAYNRQLDALFANQAADIEMDIEVMNGMLAREGLGGKSHLDLNQFMKQYEQRQQYEKENEQQKGSTANG